MHSISFQILVLSALTLQSGWTLAATDDKKPPLPCTIQSPNTGSFYDLRPLSLSPPDTDKRTKDGKTESWRVKGHDYPTNFTLNICAPVVEELKSVVGIKDKLLANVSAYYEHKGEKYSIGSQSSDLTFRGPRLVLQYTNGSPCGSSNDKKLATRDEKSPLEARKDKEAGHRQKSTIISFHCETDSTAPQTQMSFVGTDPDECAYFFEVRSQSACGGAEPVSQGLGPGGVFGVIVLIAILVYFIGGIMYQRSVAHARGWRQLPNYSMWAGIGSFFQDMFIIATSSCSRFLPSRRGYRSLSGSANGNGSRGRARPEDENRLIDQLDEEWDD